MSRIRVTVDRLVLNGLQPGQDKALVETLRAQLLQILSDRSTRAKWAHSHHTAVLRLGRVPIDPGAAGAREFGAQIAYGIARGLKP